MKTQWRTYLEIGSYEDSLGKISLLRISIEKKMKYLKIHNFNRVIKQSLWYPKIYWRRGLNHMCPYSHPNLQLFYQKLALSAYMVIIMDTQRYDGKEKRYIDYTIPDMLQMMGRATQPTQKESAKCLVFCYTPKKDFYKKFLYEPYPVESNLNQYLIDHLNAEVVAKTIENKQDCVDWITWSFMYRRLTQNPNYYNLQEISGTYINNYLSELIENTVEELETSKCLAVEDEMELLPLNLGIIASYYYISYATLDNFAKTLNPNAKMRQLIEILASANEFEHVIFNNLIN